jgi:hypothetical protein
MLNFERRDPVRGERRRTMNEVFAQSGARNDKREIERYRNSQSCAVLLLPSLKIAPSGQISKTPDLAALHPGYKPRCYDRRKKSFFSASV